MRRRVNTAQGAALGGLLASLLLQVGSAQEVDLGDIKRQAQELHAAQDWEGLARTVRQLGQAEGRRAVDLALTLGTEVPDYRVSEAARDALAALDDEEAVERMLREAERGKLDEQLLLLDAFAERGDAATGEALGVALEDREEAVVRVALASIERRLALEAVDALILRLADWEQGSDGEGLAANHARRILRRITGRDYGEAEGWRVFWDSRPDDFQPPSERELERTPPPREAGGSRERGPRPQLYEQEILSNRVVFVIDVSGSMQGRRMTRARENLIAAVEGLPADAEFTIVAYSDDVTVWSGRLREADDDAKAAAREFVEGLEAYGRTMTLAAMRAAFEVSGADAIVFLSDGRPTDLNDEGQGLSIEEVYGHIMALNRRPRWRIDTYLIGPRQAGLDRFMQGLARATGGAYTHVNR